MSDLLALLLVVLGSAARVDVFSFDDSANIMEEEHFGIVNGKATIGINYKDVAAIRGMWSPPYVSSDFGIEVRAVGERIATENYRWRPFEVERSGRVQDLGIIRSTTALVYGHRGGVIRVSICADCKERKLVPFEIRVAGTLDRTETWEFARPESATPAPIACNGNTLTMGRDAYVIVLACDVPEITWHEADSSWKVTVPAVPHKATFFNVAFAVGDKQTAQESCRMMMADPGKALDGARKEYSVRVDDLFAKLPRFRSTNESLVRFYDRSLVHLLMNRWEIPEFVLHPYYGTGSVKGGCVCNYLWNFGEVWEILPLYDPQAAREHIKQFLKTDLTAHFAFNPVTGAAFGPWYPVNQEKIIGLIYYYVKNTGDLAFLDERVSDKSVLDWVLLNALYGDDRAKPVDLIDYGPSNSHLELRRGFPYNHVMPDLNGRRYANYLLAAELAQAAGTPAPYLKERAEALRVVLKTRLWDPELRWFRFLNEKGEKDLRYTVQMFKLFGSGVLDAEEETGLLSHLNEAEFLSTQGLHSMSKTDIAYDQADIDNGGGGSCTCFPPQIAERLYKSGYAREADDILRRILWWGERMPYWGDSLVANSVDYRKDTPLQSTIDGAAAAQCIIFGLFGVEVAFNGDVTFNPHVPAFAPQVSLEGLRIRGTAFDISAEGDTFTVKTDGQVIQSKMGAPVRWNANERRLDISAGISSLG
jgi:hypothetical protein